jgi:electron transfer flavoprotein beta subunit
MKIVVPVKQVASLDEEFELAPEGSGVDPDFLEWDLNEWDNFSLEAALEIRERNGGGADEVVVVTVGDEQADEGLLSGLAMGADRAVRAWDEALEGADLLSVARVLAAVVQRERPELVLCGVQSSDAVNGATGVALAGYLDLPHVAVVKGLEYDPAAATATVERELEGGLIEVLRVRLPALLTIQTGINEPRYATLRAIKQARAKPLEVIGLAELGVGRDAVMSAAGSRLLRLATPDRDAGAQMLDGTPGELAARIAQIVEERLKG